MCRPIIGVLALVVALAAASCGGDSGTTASLAKGSFIREADAICQKAQEEIIKGASKVPIDKSPQARAKAEFAMVSTLLIPTLEEEMDRLRALGAPTGDETKIQRILRLSENAITEAKEEPESYVAGEDYRSGSEHYGDANQLARKYGMKKCLFRSS